MLHRSPLCGCSAGRMRDCFATLWTIVGDTWSPGQHHRQTHFARRFFILSTLAAHEFFTRARFFRTVPLSPLRKGKLSPPLSSSCLSIISTEYFLCACLLSLKGLKLSLPGDPRGAVSVHGGHRIHIRHDVRLVFLAQFRVDLPLVRPLFRCDFPHIAFRLTSSSSRMANLENMTCPEWDELLKRINRYFRNQSYLEGTEWASEEVRAPLECEMPAMERLFWLGVSENCWGRTFLDGVMWRVRQGRNQRKGSRLLQCVLHSWASITTWSLITGPIRIRTKGRTNVNGVRFWICRRGKVARRDEEAPTPRADSLSTLKTTPPLQIFLRARRIR